MTRFWSRPPTSSSAAASRPYLAKQRPFSRDVGATLRWSTETCGNPLSAVSTGEVGPASRVASIVENMKQLACSTELVLSGFVLARTGSR